MSERMKKQAKKMREKTMKKQKEKMREKIMRGRDLMMAPPSR